MKCITQNTLSATLRYSYAYPLLSSYWLYLDPVSKQCILLYLLTC